MSLCSWATRFMLDCRLDSGNYNLLTLVLIPTAIVYSNPAKVWPEVRYLLKCNCYIFLFSDMRFSTMGTFRQNSWLYLDGITNYLKV